MRMNYDTQTMVIAPFLYNSCFSDVFPATMIAPSLSGCIRLPREPGCDLHSRDDTATP